jgi:hypothetical protein
MKDKRPDAARGNPRYLNHVLTFVDEIRDSEWLMVGVVF